MKLRDFDAGVVSVVIVNFRGADDTIEAVRRLAEVDWPASLLEVVVVENNSGDDSATRISEAVPHVMLVKSKVNLGFAGGSNLGARKSRGEFIAFLNNDAKPDPAWIRAAVEQFETSPRIGAVACRVVDWAGSNVDYIGSALTWFGMGYKPFTGEPVTASTGQAKDVLFGTGSAMFVRREVFAALNGFDERYFMFFEDVDFGWRLNLRGWRYVYAPKSLAFHKHHASMTAFGSFKETYLLERNALFTLYKNLGSDALAEALPAALLLAIRRSVSKGALDSGSLDIRLAGGDADTTMEVSKETMAGVYAVDKFVENLPSLRASRDETQRSRVVTDARMWRLFGETDAPSYQEDSYLSGYEKIVTAFDVVASPIATRVLIITGDPIGVKMAGPAIRAWHMAHALSAKSDVTLVTLSGAEDMGAPFDIVHVRPGDDKKFDALEAWADVIIFQGHAMAIFDSLRHSGKILVVDVYDPMHLEQLEQGRVLPAATWQKQVSDATDVINEQLSRGDFFLCASERQRHFYLGQLAALGRINPANYGDDPQLTNLISVVPFGLDSALPLHERQVLKGVIPGIRPDDKVLLWGGGLYNWFDPKTLIRAVGHLSARHDNVRLFFQGTKHPHPGVPEMSIVSESRDLARELGLLDSSIFFNESWVEYSDRQNFLTEADAGVSTHHSHVETTFSFRTRILDYLWAGLPMVVTEGDHFAELVHAEGLGIVVPAGDVEALSFALEKVLFDKDFAAAAQTNITRVRESYLWDVVLKPLVEFVEEPRAARDRATSVPGAKGTLPGSRPRKRLKKHGLRHDARLIVHYMRNGGPQVVIAKIRRRLRA